MLTDQHAWIRGRLERRAKDARQAAANVSLLSLAGYPDAPLLAKVHIRAAEVYEAALRDLGGAP